MRAGCAKHARPGGAKKRRRAAFVPRIGDTLAARLRFCFPIKTQMQTNLQWFCVETVETCALYGRFGRPAAGCVRYALCAAQLSAFSTRSSSRSFSLTSITGFV